MEYFEKPHNPAIITLNLQALIHFTLFFPTEHFEDMLTTKLEAEFPEVQVKGRQPNVDWNQPQLDGVKCQNNKLESYLYDAQVGYEFHVISVTSSSTCIAYITDLQTTLQGLCNKLTGGGILLIDVAKGKVHVEQCKFSSKLTISMIRQFSIYKSHQLFL